MPYQLGTGFDEVSSQGVGGVLKLKLVGCTTSVKGDELVRRPVRSLCKKSS